MRRRKFLTTAGIGGAASTLAAPSLDTLWGGAESIARKVAVLTDNKFQIEIVPRCRRSMRCRTTPSRCATPPPTTSSARTSPSLRRLAAAGTQLKPYPREVLAAAWKATHELYDEFSSKNAKFKKIYDHWKAFRDEQYLWFRVSELTCENFAFTAAQTVK
jgi:TRAP-type mannitol/chloroaromatic compound transport system substrate-binding protein